MPGCWVEGSEAGTGEALAGVILRSLRARHRHGHWHCTGEQQQRGASGLTSTSTSTSTSTGDGDGDGNGDGDRNGITSENGEGNGEHKVEHKVVFITGETRRDVLPRVLRSGGVTVEEVVVYETRVDDEFEVGVRKAVQETEKLIQTSGVRWIVVFSGQGAREMLRGLGWLNSSNGKVKAEIEIEKEGGEREGVDCSSKDHSHSPSPSPSHSQRLRLRRTRRTTFVASIGPTTAEYLQREFGLSVDVCAETPSGEALREGIERFMKMKEASTA